MVLRPAEVAILSLICATYGVQPLGHLFGLDQLDKETQGHFYKLLAILVVGMKLAHPQTFHIFSYIQINERHFFLNGFFFFCQLL